MAITLACVAWGVLTDFRRGPARDRSSSADAPASATPMDAVSAALEALCAMFQENPERVSQRNAVISAHAELRERNLTKHARLVAAMASALIDRGCPDPAASLTAETRARRIPGRRCALDQRIRPAGPAGVLPGGDGGTEVCPR
jgi:hypothetical protein